MERTAAMSRTVAVRYFRGVLGLAPRTGLNPVAPATAIVRCDHASANPGRKPGVR